VTLVDVGSLPLGRHSQGQGLRPSLGIGDGEVSREVGFAWRSGMYCDGRMSKELWHLLLAVMVLEILIICFMVIVNG